MRVVVPSVPEPPYVQTLESRPRFFAVRPGKPVRFGRAETSDVVVADDRVSRVHAQVLVENGQVFLEDLESRNGTSVDGRPIDSAVRLAKATKVILGERSADIVPGFAFLVVPSQAELDSGCRTAADAPFDAALRATRLRLTAELRGHHVSATAVDELIDSTPEGALLLELERWSRVCNQFDELLDVPDPPLDRQRGASGEPWLGSPARESVAQTIALARMFRSSMRTMIRQGALTFAHLPSSRHRHVGDVGSPCEACGTLLTRMEGHYHWRGDVHHGAYCATCHSVSPTAAEPLLERTREADDATVESRDTN